MKPKNWIHKNLDTKSQSFCGAKWYNSTIWLGNGSTTSCHHPPPHKINEEEIKSFKNDNSKVESEVKLKVKALCDKFPIYSQAI